MTQTTLIESLHSFRRRVRLLTLVTGVGYALAAAVGAVLAVVLVDYLLNLQAVSRIVAMILAAGAIAWVLARHVVRPLASRLPLTDVAGRLEEAFPQFDDRLRSTVNFIGGGDVHAPAAMKQRVIDEATTLARTVDLTAAIETRPAVRAGGMAAAALAAVVLLSVASPETLRIGVARLVAPFSSAAWPKWVQIDLLDPPPRRVAVGQQVPVKVRLARGDRASRDVTIHYQYLTAGPGGTAVADGPAREEFMTRAPDGTYAASLDARLAAAAQSGSLRVWVEAGDDRVDVEPIAIVTRLAIAGVQAVVTPPAYAKLAPATVNLADAPAVVAAGSDVRLVVSFNKPLAQPAFTFEPLAANAAVPAFTFATAPTADGASSALTASTVSGSFAPTESVRFHLRATDVDGFENPGLEEYEIIVRPDQSPTVQIEEPRRSEERTATAVVPLRAVAEDDFAIRSASLWVERLSDKRKWELPLMADEAATGGASVSPGDSGPDRRRYRLAYEWELSALAGADLKPGDVLEYCVGVTDNYALNGATHPPAYSGKLRVTVISQDELAARVGDEIRAAAVATRDTKNAQQRTAVETANLADETKDRPALDDADRAAAERIANQQATAASSARAVATKLDAALKRLDENRSPNADLRDTAKEARDQLAGAAEGPMTDASRAIASAKDRQPDPKDPKKSADDRNADFKNAAAKQGEANDALQKALDRLGNTGSLSQTMEQFRGLLAEQQKVSAAAKDFARENVGKTDLSPDERAKLDKLARDQKALAERTEKAIADAARAAEQVSKSDPASAESLKQAAATGQQQQVSPSQQRASQSMKGNKQDDAQKAQKQAELGLEMIINALRDAERRKLEELAKKLAELQQQLAILVRRQANHNVDNVRGQGAGAIAKLTAEVLADLAEKSGRAASDVTAGADVAPAAGQQAGSQQQTERNARDLAKAVADTPDGAEPSAALTRAAGRMERAIVHLRATKLPDAYDPPQVEALAALAEAKRVVDEQQRKAQEKIDQQQRDAVRARYEKIKIEQERLNAETAKVDKARDKDGKLPRAVQIALNPLPGQQGKAADDTKAIEEDLSAAGAIVYVWANKDIVEAMTTVKDALGRQQTDEEVRVEQARVVEQLDAMIRNLSIKPAEKKFDAKAAAGGGQGGGGGAPPLPSEAELRLLKDLQRAVNNATAKLAAIAPRPEKKLEGLGGRQGDMRGVLDQMIRKASQGQMQLGPEPDNRDQLPEEATAENVEDQELEAELLNDKPDAAELQKGVNRVGDRMARSRQRLAINHDAGRVTQVIQERILKDLDELIEEARNQQSQPSQSQPKPGDGGQKMAGAKPGDGAQPGEAGAAQPRPAAGGAEAAADSNRTEGGTPEVGTPTDIRQAMSEWGAVTPRLRQAVVEGSGETVIEKYKGLVDDYYRALAEKREGN